MELIEPSFKRDFLLQTTERIEQLHGIFDEACVDLKSACIKWRNDNNHRLVWIPSKEEAVFNFLLDKEINNLIKEQTFYDVGSGDGRILFIAREAGAPKAVGYEINTGLWNAAKELHSSSKMLHRFTNIDYRNADFFKEKLYKKPGIYYIWPDPNTTLDDVCKKLHAETPQSLLIVYSNYVVGKQKRLPIYHREFLFNNHIEKIGLYKP